MQSAIEEMFKKNERHVAEGEFRQPYLDLLAAKTIDIVGRKLMFNHVQRILWEHLHDTMLSQRVVVIGYFDDKRILHLSPPSTPRIWNKDDCLVIIRRTQKAKAVQSSQGPPRLPPIASTS